MACNTLASQELDNTINNHKINGKVTAKNTNIYKVLDVVQAEEMIAYTSFERANLGQFKRKDNAQLLNLQTINNLVL